MAFPSRLNARQHTAIRFLPKRPRRVPIVYAPRISFSKRRASLRGYLTLLWLQYCIATFAGADSNDVYDVSSLPEPHGFDGAMAVRRRIGAQISQSRPAGHIRQIVRTVGRRAGTDLAHIPHLLPSSLWHRQSAGGQSGTGGDRGGRLRDAIRFVAAFQEGKFAGAA